MNPTEPAPERATLPPPAPSKPDRRERRQRRHTPSSKHWRKPHVETCDVVQRYMLGLYDLASAVRESKGKSRPNFTPKGYMDDTRRPADNAASPQVA